MMRSQKAENHEELDKVIQWPSGKAGHDTPLAIASSFPHGNRAMMDVEWPAANGRNALGVEIAAQNQHHIDSRQRRCRPIRDEFKHVLGIAMLKDQIKELRGARFIFRHEDATSGNDLNEHFDLAFIGDVIEHATKLLFWFKFAVRNLTKSGRILVAAPIPTVKNLSDRRNPKVFTHAN